MGMHSVNPVTKFGPIRKSH